MSTPRPGARAARPRTPRDSGEERIVTDDPDQPDQPDDADLERPAPEPEPDVAPAEPVDDTDGEPTADELRDKVAALAKSLPLQDPRQSPPSYEPTGLVTFEVGAPNREGLVQQMVDTLRSYRPDIPGWWVTMAARGESIDPYSSDRGGGPVYWIAAVEAVPANPDLLDVYRRGIGPQQGRDGRESFYLEVACPNCPIDGHGQPTRTGWVVDVLPSVIGSGPYAMSVSPAGGSNDHVDASDARWLQGLINRDLTGQNPIAREEALVAMVVAGIDAMRMTREYVDPRGERLPAVQSWGWFDWVNASQQLIRDLGFTNDNEWHPEAAPPQAHVPAPPVHPRTAPTDAVEGFFDAAGRPDNSDAHMAHDVTRVEAPDVTAVDVLPTAETWLPAVPAADAVRARPSGSTPAIVARPDPSMARPAHAGGPRKPGRFARFAAAWRAAGQSPAPAPEKPDRLPERD